MRASTVLLVSPARRVWEIAESRESRRVCLTPASPGNKIRLLAVSSRAQVSGRRRRNSGAGAALAGNKGFYPAGRRPSRWVLRGWSNEDSDFKAQLAARLHLVVSVRVRRNGAGYGHTFRQRH